MLHNKITLTDCQYNFMAETKEEIKQRIQQERGEYTRARTKKFLHLKHTGQLQNYYLAKQGLSKKKIYESLKRQLDREKATRGAKGLRGLWRLILNFLKQLFTGSPAGVKTF